MRVWQEKYRYDKIKGEKEIGVTTGLAWTVVGGDTLFIETTAVPLYKEAAASGPAG